MNINEIYNQSKDNFLFTDSQKFSLLREDLLRKFDLSPKIKKKNESLKFLDPNILDFFYKYNFIPKEISHTNHDEDNINISVINGRVHSVSKKDKNNIDFKINNIDNSNQKIIEKFLDFQSNFDNDYILNLNSLMMNSGYEIKIGKNQVINIYIFNSVSEKGLTIFQKNLISCSSNCKVNIFEDCIIDKQSNSNIVNFLDIDEDSEVKYFIFQKNNEKINLQSTSYANCSRNSKYEQLTINLSKGSTRNHHYVNLIGERATAKLDGIFFGSKNQFIDNKTQINHKSPNCISSQRYKGILTSNSKASYLSKTFVEKTAQKTEAYQTSKGILLSDNSYFHSKPELRIYADDVKCSHGSTIGPIDSDLLFYLRSRGLSKKKSTSLLIKSFFNDIISQVSEKVFLEKFNYYCNIWLKENDI